jgi:hypothetical protein
VTIGTGQLLYVTDADGVERRYILGCGAENEDGTVTWHLIADPDDDGPPETITAIPAECHRWMSEALDLSPDNPWIRLSGRDIQRAFFRTVYGYEAPEDWPG